MNITIFGIGYVGIVQAVCMAELGNNVFCYDNDIAKIDLINKGLLPIAEPGLAELFERNKSRLIFSTDSKQAVEYSRAVFVAVGTPDKKDGSANLGHVYDVCDCIARYANEKKFVIMKSTVPPGTGDDIQAKFDTMTTEKHYVLDVVSNPEFLSQGTAIHDWFGGSRIVLGVANKEVEKFMRGLYHGLRQPIVVTSRSSAELIKYASNDFLALKISYINEIANFCELVGANIDEVSFGMSLDPRIGGNFLKAGIGYGGSCFPKDTKALHWLAHYNDYELKTIKAAIEVNEKQKMRLVKKASKIFSDLSYVQIAVLGLSFKPGTDDIRESPAVENIQVLLEKGAKIRVWDPLSMSKVRRIFGDEVEYSDSVSGTIENAQICMIFTDHDEIKEYSPAEFKARMKQAIVLDGRNCFSLSDMKAAGVYYESIGRGIVE